MPNGEEPETSRDARIAKLQDALLEGRIDKATYDQLKADLLAVASPATASEEPPPPPCASGEEPTPVEVYVEPEPPTPVDEEPPPCPQAPPSQSLSGQAQPVVAFNPPLIPENVDQAFQLLRYPWRAPTPLPDPLAKPFQAALQAIIQSYAARLPKKYYVGSGIPEKKLQNAQASMCVPPMETIQALLDSTAFESGKAGIAITNNAIYWRLAATALFSEKGPFRMDYGQLMRFSIWWHPTLKSGAVGSFFGKTIRFEFLDNSKPVYEMLLEIQRALHRMCGWQEIKSENKNTET